MSKYSNLLILSLIIVLVLLGIYIFFSIRPTSEQVESYTKPVLVVPDDILSNTSEQKIKDYTVNQPLKMQPKQNNRENPFSPY